jgi:hypothetical protein
MINVNVAQLLRGARPQEKKKDAGKFSCLQPSDIT